MAYAHTTNASAHPMGAMKTPYTTISAATNCVPNGFPITNATSASV